jgi:fucose 4-O-acetylase-like acetyltransferase
MNKDKYNVFKGITILLVVSIHVLYKFYGHDKPILLEVMNYVTSFSVPLFMILGGYFFTSKLESLSSFYDLKKIFKRLFKRIIIPYYIFVLILICFNLISGINMDVWPLLLLYDANTHGLYFILIYIYSYVFSALIYYILIKYLTNNKYIILTYIVPTIGLLFIPLTYYFIKLFPYNTVVSSLTYISYFFVGFPIYYICKRISLLKFYMKIKIYFIFLFCVIIYTVLLYYMRTIFGHFSVITTSPPTLFLLIYSIFVFMFFYFILEQVDYITFGAKCIMINKFGEESLFIFFIHPYFIYLLPIIFNAICKDIIHTNMFIIPWIISTYLITFCSLLIYKLLPSRIKTVFSR